MADLDGVTRMTVPFVDLRRSQAEVMPEILRAIEEVATSGRYTGQTVAADFEEAFGRFTGALHCVGVGSGLDALRIALLALGIGSGDEVIVSAATFVATYEAIVQAGARPVPADISPSDRCLDPAAAEAAIGPNTRVVLPVHLYGQQSDMTAIAKIASKHGVALLEDACQAHGASRDGLRVGEGSSATAYSFYPTKNLGALGDAGCLTTDNEDIVARARSLRLHGRDGGRHERVGYTAGLDSIQAAALTQKLRRLRHWNRQRGLAALEYSERLKDIEGLELPTEHGHAAWHLYVIRVSDPDDLAAFLAIRGIQTHRHYARAPHLEQAFRWLGCPDGSMPETEALFREALSVPLFPGITQTEIDYVAFNIRSYFEHGAQARGRTNRSSSRT